MGHADNKRENLEQTELLLIRSHPQGITKQAISEKLGLDPSTVHRYIVEIESVEEVTRGKYTIDPKRYTKNVRLSQAEAITIYLALRKFIRQTGKATEFMINAIQKILSLLANEDLKNQLQESTVSLSNERPADKNYTEVWNALLEGWQNQNVVSIDYVKQGSDTPETHDIEPYLFEPQVFGDGLYVLAWSRTRNALRTFKPDRIQHASVRPIRFEKRVNLTLETLLKHSWGIWYGEEPVKVELLFDKGTVANRVLETTYFPTEEKVLQQDGTLYWSAEVVGTIEILSWIRGWGHGVIVISPSKLREQVINDLKKTIALYSD